MLDADWLGHGAPSLRIFRTIGVRGIKTWCAFGAPSHFLSKKYNLSILLCKFHHNVILPGFFYGCGYTTRSGILVLNAIQSVRLFARLIADQRFSAILS